MCLLPQDKLEIYLKTHFHMTAGKTHARLPYNYLTTSDTYPDKLTAVLGKVETSFTFTLTDNIVLNRYDSETGNTLGTYEGRTSDIGQDKGDGWIPLIDEQARLMPGQVSMGEYPGDPRVKFQGYGYIIEGFNVKCRGKVPYTITFYSPEGYLSADEDGDLKKDESKDEWNHPYNRPGLAVWRGQYSSEALFRDDTRLWQNTKNLAKPNQRVWAPHRYPRALLPTPPVDLKDPTKWTDVETKVKTNWVKKYVGDIFNSKTIPVPPGEEVETQKVLVAYWDIPERAIKTQDEPIIPNFDSFDWVPNTSRFEIVKSPNTTCKHTGTHYSALTVEFYYQDAYEHNIYYIPNQLVSTYNKKYCSVVQRWHYWLGDKT